jgi:RNA polymerase sigma-70 factor (ECF subfamily)
VIDGTEDTVEQREAVSLALLTLMERLTPEQRIVYVLREGFGLSYEEIAAHLNKTAAACRQIFRRAQMRLTDRQRALTAPSTDHRQLVEGFLDAFARGDAARVATILAEDVTWVADSGPNRLANRRGVIGRDKVSRGLAGLVAKIPPDMELTTSIIDLNGAPAIAVFVSGSLDRIFAFDIVGSEITSVRVLINPEKLDYLARALGTEPTWESPFRGPRAATSA